MKPMLDRGHRFWLKRAYSWRRCAGFFEPNYLPCFRANPCITTVADLSVLELPHVHPADRVTAWRTQLETCLRWTTHFICHSRATANRLEQLLSIPAKNISVIPHGSRWRVPTCWNSTSLKAQLRLPERYLLHLGTIEPRKNLKCLLDAYALKSETWRRRTPLILAGTPGWGLPSFWNELREHPMAEYAYTTGYLSDTQAQALLFAAQALVFPSLYEGFGLPALEAMAMGVPVIASNTTSLPEVCGDAAVLLPPEDIQAWAEWVERVAESGEEHAQLAHAGLRRAELFNWEKSAQQHHDLFDRLCGKASNRSDRHAA